MSDPKMTMEEQARILRDQAPRAAEARERLKTPAPVEGPGLGARIIALLRRAMPKAPERLESEVKDVAVGLPGRKRGYEHMNEIVNKDVQ